MAYWVEEKKLRQARALASSDWESPKSLMKMRHMAKDGATIDEIVAALGWSVCEATVTKRLKKYNIVAGRKKHGKRIRIGGDPYFRINGSSDIDMRTWKPLAKSEKTGV